jgi:hypothetical protein
VRTEHVSGLDRTDTADPYGHRVVVDERSTAPTRYSANRVWRALTLAAGVLGGAVLVVMGLLALARGDLEGSWSEPIVLVNGWPHSPLLGLLEVIAGAALITVSLSPSSELVVGAIIAAFGAVALLEPQVLDDSLRFDPSHAWLIIAIGGVAVLGSAIAYFIRPKDRAVHTSDVEPYSRVEDYREEYIDEPPFS